MNYLFQSRRFKQQADSFLLLRANVLADPVYRSFNLMFSLDQVRLSSYMLVVCFDTLLATSVDGEQVFSVGRTAIKHNQHALSVNTFQAKVALGQWVDQPFMPSINVLAEAIRPKHPKLEEPLNAVQTSKGSSMALIEIDE
jgi:hypothetical protein